MFKTNDLIRNAIIAALYAALTISLAPLSYGPIQVRVSEFMTLLAFTNRKCMPGLVLGCFLANIGSPYGLIIGAKLAYLTAIPAGTSVVATMFYIGAGEFVSVSV